MSEQNKAKNKKNQYFWRACRYLLPYRAKVIVSIVAALFVGLAMAGGLTTMVPIMNVLLNGDTVQGWAYRRAAENRLNVTFSQDDVGVIEIVHVDDVGPAKRAGLHSGDIIEGASLPDNPRQSPFPVVKREDLANADTRTRAFAAGEILRRVAWADHPANQLDANGNPARSIILTTRNGPFTAILPQPKPFSDIGLRVVELMPIRPVRSVAVVFGVLAVLSVIGYIARFFQEHLSDQCAILAVNDLRRRLYDKVLRIPISAFGQTGSSDATSRLVSDTDQLQDGFKTVLGQSIQEPIKAFFGFCVALYFSWTLTLFIIIFAPLMAVMMRKFGKKMRRASRAAMRSSSVMLGQIEGTLTGIRVVKAFNAQRFERRRYTNIMKNLVVEQVKMSYIDAMSAPIMESMILVMAGCVILFAAYQIMVAKTLHVPTFVTVMIALATIAESLRKASKVNNALQKSNAAAARIFELLDIPAEVEIGRKVDEPAETSVENRRKLPPLQTDIKFEEIVFTYPNTNSPALNGVCLTVPKGQSVAIVGRNGSGKTTLLALLERYYDPDQGRILIDGIDIRNVTRKSLRDQISIVTQDSHIFPGTIAENIAYGILQANPDEPDSPSRRELFQRIQAAAKRAFAHDFIMEKPGGYDMQLGGLGGQLSGGQRQRLCIARAIFHQAPILILDEATSQVDAESEHLIHEAIEHLMHERTTFVIAHRFSTILSADKIVVMERGQIVGQGKHEELLETCETYQQLYERQLGAAR